MYTEIICGHTYSNNIESGVVANRGEDLRFPISSSLRFLLSHCHLAYIVCIEAPRRISCGAFLFSPLKRQVFTFMSFSINLIRAKVVKRMKGASTLIQRFIELGEGYSDLYELIELAKANKHRLTHFIAFNTTVNENQVISLAIVLTPTNPGNFQPLYICREGIPNPEQKPNKRYELFKDLAESFEKKVITLEVKPSTMFNEKELYYQHLIGILRMNRYIPPMQ
jgi:hypothetical protein